MQCRKASKGRNVYLMNFYLVCYVVETMHALLSAQPWTEQVTKVGGGMLPFTFTCLA